MPLLDESDFTLSHRSNTMNRNQTLRRIGRKLTHDFAFYRRFKELRCDPGKGILPRGLVYETEQRNGSTGCVIVGLNPGVAEKEEKAVLRKNPTYNSFLRFWQDHIADKPYYARLRNAADALGLKGPILWTELVKCQSWDNGKVCVQTIRADVNRYLLREIDAVPLSWPLIGVGKKAYEILSYLYPKRVVIGIPHATGAYGGFAKIYDSRKRTLMKKPRQQLLRALRQKQSTALFKSDYF